jgi:hypothetical protein
VANSLDSGFAAYRLADPVVLADINGTAFVDNGDASILLQIAAGNALAQVPAIPIPAPPIVPSGAPRTVSASAPQSDTARARRDHWSAQHGCSGANACIG